MGIFFILYLLLVVGLLGFSIYCLVLFVKLAKRGIKALDIYISNNENKNYID